MSYDPLEKKFSPDMERAKDKILAAGAEVPRGDVNFMLEAIIASSPLAIIVADNTNYVRIWNPAAEQMFGWREEEVVGKLLPVVPDGKFTEFADIHAAVKRRDAVIIKRTQRQRKDGEVLDVSLSVAPVLDGGNNIVGWVKIAADITEHLRGEIRLRESEEKYRAILENMEEGFHEVDLRGNFTFFNKSFARIMGYSGDELMGMNYRHYAADEANRQAVYAAYNSVFQTGEPLESFTWDIVRKDGMRRTVEVSTSLIRDMDGQPLGFRGIVRDITERKASVDRLRKTLGATVQAIASLVETRDPYTAGHQRRVADLARAVATEMGLPRARIDGLRMASTIHDIGKISIPAEILSMPRKLTDIEFGLIKSHPQAGFEILKDIDFPWPVARMVLEHHERLDGSGYPRGLKDDDVLLESKILIVADVVESMASHRPYRPAHGLDAAMKEIAANRGVLYDPDVVDACITIFRDKDFRMT